MLRGLEGSIVTQKKCRRHYGFHLGLEYNPDIHMGYDKSTRHVWYCPFTDKQWLSGFIAWKINKVRIYESHSPMSVSSFMNSMLKSPAFPRATSSTTKQSSSTKSPSPSQQTG